MKLPNGAKTFQTLASQTLKFNDQLKESNQLLDKMAESFGNTVRWGITSSL
jgi:hypothetical protein